jgi:hypothetical protein
MNFLLRGDLTMPLVQIFELQFRFCAGLLREARSALAP